MKTTKRNTRASSPAPPGELAGADCAATILRRRYVADLRPEITDELFVRIEHEGQFAFFPLSTNRREVADHKAETLRRMVAQSGWHAAGAQFIREFTLAIFWLPNPLTCTYATLFTALVAPQPIRRSLAPRVRVALFEPDEKTRWGLLHWLNQLPDYECVSAHDSASAFLKNVARTRPELALFNDPPCAPASEHIQERLKAELPDQVGFSFGTYADSDHAWHCVTGVDGGYYYRRRRPTQMLEPISGLWQTQKPSRDVVESQLRHHIQTLFGLRAAPEEAFPGLTNRERDVLMGLRRGHTDKSLASMLNISSWTVHTHMKSLFDKLGVHTRAEAVAKFFEK
ncbi:MAG: LuxR C-terminal-related transcriptional regulator [Verrucomicrobiota bacterium]